MNIFSKLPKTYFKKFFTVYFGFYIFTVTVSLLIATFKPDAEIRWIAELVSQGFLGTTVTYGVKSAYENNKKYNDGDGNSVMPDYDARS